MASNLMAMACNLIMMVSNLEAMASNLEAMASSLILDRDGLQPNRDGSLHKWAKIPPHGVGNPLPHVGLGADPVQYLGRCKRPRTTRRRKPTWRALSREAGSE